MLTRHPLLSLFALLFFLSIGFYFMPSQKVTYFNVSAIQKRFQSVKGIAIHRIATSAATPRAKPNSKPTKMITPTPTTDSTIVTYDDSGFSPQVITIKKGDTVTFKNTSETDMWVASNYFPTSKLYPDTDAAKCYDSPIPVMFDECVGVTNGKSWSFEFNSIGRWPYHNHLKPNDGGTIIVTAN